MSEQTTQSSAPPATTPRDDDETTLSPGVPGPSGTGTATDAGADPDAPKGEDR